MASNLTPKFFRCRVGQGLSAETTQLNSTSSTMSKIYSDLSLPEAKRVATTIYDLTIGSKAKKADVLQLILDEMAEDQECDRCDGGDCNPVAHKFTLEEYDANATKQSSSNSELETYRKALLDVCAAANIPIDLPTGDGEQAFTEGVDATGASSSQMVEAIKKKLAAAEKTKPSTPLDSSSDSSKSESEDQESDEEETATVKKKKKKKAKKSKKSTSSNDLSIKDILSVFMKSQQESSKRQDKLMEGMMNIVQTGQSRQTSSIVDLTGISSDNSEKPKVTMVKVPNPLNAAWAGVSLAPLFQIEGDPANLDLSRMKRKLQSGEDSQGHLGVVKEIRWVQMCLNSGLCPQGRPKHSQMSPTQYFSGMSNLILIEASSEKPNFVIIINQTRHMSRIASLALSMEWSDCLELDATLFRNMEQAQLTWLEWPEIEKLHSVTKDFLLTRAATSGPSSKRFKEVDQRPSQNTNTNMNMKDRVSGILISFMKDQCFCIKFQSGRCPQKGDHLINVKDITVKHSCAGCCWLKLPEDSSHGAQTCPNKSSFFGK